jgi:hypothetical protein
MDVTVTMMVCNCKIWASMKSNSNSNGTNGISAQMKLERRIHSSE